MATQLWLESVRNGSGVDMTPPGSLSSDTDLPLLTARGAGEQLLSANTVLGPTSGVQIKDGIPTPVSWWYRVNAVTISGAITKNFWMAESNMSANVGAQVIIDRCDSSGAFISTVHNSEKGTELPVGTRAAQNWNTGTVTSTTFDDGDHIRVRVYGNDVGTMASGFSFNMAVSGTTAAADGDSYVTFTETITAYSAVPRVPRFTPYPQLLSH